LQRRTRAFQQELQARRPVFVQQEAPPRRRLVSDDIQIEVLDAARTPFDNGIFDLLVGSPPFALDVPYADGGDVPDYPTYRQRMAEWSAELYRISNPVHGRVCLEIPVDRSKNGVYEPVYAHWVQALEGAGFHYRTTVYRRYHAGRGTARGSVDSPSATHTFAPLLATIIVYRGQDWIRRCDRPHDLGHDDWLALAGPNGCWDDVPGEADPDHPAPFHSEMPRRLIKLYSWREDLVGDLFLGRGTTALACVELGRRFLGGERSPTYVAIAGDRVAAALDRERTAA
jgi:site-specific DNA-methyltransferase (adenine-specific)